MILLPYKILGGLLVVLAMLAGVLGYGHTRYNAGLKQQSLVDDNVIKAMKLQADATLLAETAKVTKAEQFLQTFKDNQEIQDATHAKTVDSLTDKLRTIGRLRDPNQTGCGAGSGGTKGQTPASSGGGSIDNSQTGGLLSAGITELLERLTRESDQINVAYASCRADAFNLRAAP